MPAANTVALISLGCAKNLVDSQAMLGLLEQAGYELVEEPQDADIIIVNTCAFIEPAREEAVDALLELADHKEKDGCRALICAGCLAERDGEELLEVFPEVDAFVGVGGVPRIVEAVRGALEGRRGIYNGPLTYLYDGSTPRLRTGPEWLAYLKVADGCNHRCAFCTIPDIRGGFRSVPPEAVHAQFEDLVREQVQEVCLVAQDTSAYGRDLDPATGLAALLDRLLKVPFDGWLRVMYLHPDSLVEALIARMCVGPPVTPYFDIPLQHASRPVLRSMGRAGDADSYLDLVDRIRRYDPQAAIRSTFIVGFPGETEADFGALLDFVQAARLDRLACFRYWPEEGTRAAGMPGQVPVEEADERLDELMRVQEEVSLQRNQGFLGRRLRVLVEECLEPGRVWAGRTYRDAPEVDGQIKLTVPHGTPGPEPGSFVEVEVTAAEVHDLSGTVVTSRP